VLCAANARLAGQNLAGCVNAACQVHDATKARHWIALASAPHRDEMIAACRNLGTAIEVARPVIKPAGPNCDEDPMACRH
jgi:hypothetical protein